MKSWHLFIFVLFALFVACNQTPPTTAGSAATLKVVNRSLADAALTDVEDERVVSLWVIGRADERVDLAELSDYPDVKKLTLQECTWLTDADLKHLAQLPQLTTLSLMRVSVSDKGLAHLAELPLLSELRLVHTDVAGHGLKHLHGGKLRRLEVHGLKPTQSSLASLDGFEALTELVVRCQSVNLAEFSSVSTLSRLESLDVRLCSGLDDSFVAGLSPLSGLRSFWFDSRGFTDTQLKTLCRLTALQEVDLNHSAVSNEGLSDLATLPELRTLCLNGCPAVTDEGLRRLTAAPELESLFLTHTGVTGTGLADLTSLKTLRHVSIFSGQINRAGRQTIRELGQTHPEVDIFVESQ